MAKVTRQFREISHNDHIYNEGDTYPAEGFEADEERVSFLSKKHPTYGVPFLSVEDEKELTKVKEEKKEKVSNVTSKNKSSTKK
jgi:hypothetical protein